MESIYGSDDVDTLNGFAFNFIIPFAFTRYFPSAYFLGKGSFVSGVLLTIVIAIGTMFVAYRNE